jgi:hypothetical protein
MTKAQAQVDVMILSELAAICKKLVENPVVPEKLRARAQGFVDGFTALAPYEGTGSRGLRFEGEQLLIRIARFLPDVPGALDAESEPE